MQWEATFDKQQLDSHCDDGTVGDPVPGSLVPVHPAIGRKNVLWFQWSCSVFNEG